MRRLVHVFVIVSMMAAVPGTVAAQTENGSLSALLPNLYLNTVANEIDAFVTVLPRFGIPVDRNALIQLGAARLRTARQIIELAGNQVSSFPLASASGGFAWTLDTASGAFTRASNSFGPIFAERPLTIGRKRLNVGATFQHVSFDHLEDRALQGGQVVGYLSAPVSRNDNIFFADALDLKVTTDTLNTFATYGLTDRLDIGVAVPINRVEMRATLTSRIGFTSTGISDEDPNVFSTSGSASGLGDVVVRAKYNIARNRRWGIAESIDVRLPTGDESNLLGIAGPTVKLAFIASSDVGAFSPHVNLAYTIPGPSDADNSNPDNYLIAPPHEINYAAGADVAVSSRATIAADVVGRVMRKVGTLSWGPSAFGGAQYSQFQVTTGDDLHLLLGSVGLKVNPFKNMLFTTNVLFPLTKSGLTDSLTWMIGVEHSF